MKKLLALLLALTLCWAPLAIAEETPTLTFGETQAPAEETEAPAETAEPAEEPEAALPLTGVIIGIDPGHQEHQNKEQEAVAPGSSETKKKCSSGTEGRVTHVAEYVVNLDVSLQLRDALEALGCTVVMTRTANDVDISNQERAKMMNEAGVDLWLRVHCDGSESSSEKNGISMYVCETGDTAEESYRAGECLVDAMCEATGAKNRGVTRTDAYTGNNWSERPCVLVEMGYMSNAEEDARLNTPSYQAELVEGMVNGIRAFVGK